MPNICALIVTYNAEPWIRQNLISLMEGTLKPHIIVVDNASADATTAIIEAEFPEVELIKQTANSGFGIGNNIGIARALQLSAEYVFLLNQDAYVTDTTVAMLYEFLDQHTEFGVVSPLHCSPDLEQLDRRTQRGYLQTYAQAYLSDACLGKPQAYYQIKGINAAAWFVRSVVFQQIGGFDPLFFMYGEDDDLMNRMAFHQIKFALLTESRVVHLRESPTTPQSSFWSSILKTAKRERSTLIVELKHPAHSLPHRLSCLFLQGFLVPLEVFVMKKDIKVLLGGFLAVLQVVMEMPKIYSHARICASTGGHFID